MRAPSNGELYACVPSTDGVMDGFPFGTWRPHAVQQLLAEPQQQQRAQQRRVNDVRQCGLHLHVEPYVDVRDSERNCCAAGEVVHVLPGVPPLVPLRITEPWITSTL